MATWQDSATMSVLSAHPTLTFLNATPVPVRRHLQNANKEWTSATLPQPAAVAYFSDNLRGIDIMCVTGGKSGGGDE